MDRRFLTRLARSLVQQWRSPRLEVAAASLRNWWVRQLLAVQQWRSPRLEVAAAAVSCTWAGATLSARLTDAAAPASMTPPAQELPVTLALLALVAMALTYSGLALDDLIDARHDRLLAPRRAPVHPLGASAVASLLVALAAALTLGAVAGSLILLAAWVSVFFVVAGVFIPAAGVASLATVVLLLMLAPDPTPAFIWPIVLTITHVTVCASVWYVLTLKRPRIRTLDGWLICGGWLFAVLVLLGVSAPTPAERHGVHVWLGPIVAIFAFIVLVWINDRRLRGRGWRRRNRGRVFTRWAALWVIVYHAAWLVGFGRLDVALLLAGVGCAAWLAPHAVQYGRAWRAEPVYDLVP